MHNLLFKGCSGPLTQDQQPAHDQIGYFKHLGVPVAVTQEQSFKREDLNLGNV